MDVPSARAETRAVHCVSPVPRRVLAPRMCMINIYSLPAKVAGVHTALPGSSPPALTSLPSKGVGGSVRTLRTPPGVWGTGQSTRSSSSTQLMSTCQFFTCPWVPSLEFLNTNDFL